ncbi:hypothetical protein F5X99DRAFT_404520 [Biscogniauxia marginata]|nr:hypothetical protein F5X99DRAFT_404520 [Biscogniauxia marginata]
MPKSHAIARERGPPFFYKKASQPTSGARAVTSQWVDYGWSIPLSKETNEMVKKILVDANSMYVLQIKRDRPVDAFSIRNALFWEHRKLPNQRIVSTPETDHFGFFSSLENEFAQGMKEIERVYSDDYESVRMHKFFETIREREFLVWPIEIDKGVWTTLILRIQPKRPDAADANQTAKTFYDREVTDISIIDLWEEGRQTRRAMILQRLPEILVQGSIKLARDIKVRMFHMNDVSNDWKTGYVAYAISSEFLRRLKILTWRREIHHTQDMDFVWGEFEERYNIDLYRQSMMAACAHQCIEKSEYRVRMCLEVPSDGSQYFPDELSHINASTVTMRQEQLPDERYSFSFDKDEDARPVVLHFTERSRKRAEQEILRKQKQVLVGNRTQRPLMEEISTKQTGGGDEKSVASSLDFPEEPVAGPSNRQDTISPESSMAIRSRDDRELHFQRLNVRGTPEVPSRTPTPINKAPRFRYRPRAGHPEPDPQDALAVGDAIVREEGSLTVPEASAAPDERYISGGVYAMDDSDSSEEDESQDSRAPIAPMEPASFAHTYHGIPGLGTLNTDQPDTNTGPEVPRLTFNSPVSDVSMDDRDLFGDNPTGLVAKTPEGGLSPRLNLSGNSSYSTSAVAAPPPPPTYFGTSAYESGGTRGPVQIQSAAQGDQYPGTGAGNFGGASEFRAPLKRGLDDDDREDSAAKKPRHGGY